MLVATPKSPSLVQVDEGKGKGEGEAEIAFNLTTNEGDRGATEFSPIESPNTTVTPSTAKPTEEIPTQSNAQAPVIEAKEEEKQEKDGLTSPSKQDKKPQHMGNHLSDHFLIAQAIKSISCPYPLEKMVTLREPTWSLIRYILTQVGDCL